MCLSDNMIISVGSRQKKAIDYLKSRNGEWVKGKELMLAIYPATYAKMWGGNNLSGQLDTVMKAGIIERRSREVYNKFGRVAEEWFEYRYTNPKGHSIRCIELQWEEGKPFDWEKVIYIDGEIVYRGKEW